MIYGNLVNITIASNSFTTDTGLTITIDKDEGTITVDGTYTGSTEYIYWVCGSGSATTFNYPFDVILSGCPAGSSLTTYLFGGHNIGTCITERTILKNTKFSIAVIIEPNAVCDNIVFKPMVRPAYINTNTYNPYAMRIQGLTKKANEITGKFVTLTTFKPYYSADFGLTSFRFNGGMTMPKLSILSRASSYPSLAISIMSRYHSGTNIYALGQPDGTFSDINIVYGAYLDTKDIVYSLSEDHKELYINLPRYDSGYITIYNYRPVTYNIEYIE